LLIDNVTERNSGFPAGDSDEEFAESEGSAVEAFWMLNTPRSQNLPSSLCLHWVYLGMFFKPQNT